MAKKDITNTDLVKIEPITDNQKLVFDSYAKGQHQFMFGSAGTGKTFISLYLQHLYREHHPMHLHLLQYKSQGLLR